MFLIICIGFLICAVSLDNKNDNKIMTNFCIAGYIISYLSLLLCVLEKGNGLIYFSTVATGLCGLMIAQETQNNITKITMFSLIITGITLLIIK